MPRCKFVNFDQNTRSFWHNCGTNFIFVSRTNVSVRETKKSRSETRTGSSVLERTKKWRESDAKETGKGTETETIGIGKGIVITGATGWTGRSDVGVSTRTRVVTMALDTGENSFFLNILQQKTLSKGFF